MQSLTLTVQKEENSDELFLQFPDELMRELDWREGDTLRWETFSENSSSKFRIANVSLEERNAAPTNKLQLYEVQVLVSHRVRYAVKAQSAEEATATVMNENNGVAEFDQNCLGTQLISSQKMSLDQYLSDPGHVGTDAHKVSLIHRAS